MITFVLAIWNTLSLPLLAWWYFCITRTGSERLAAYSALRFRPVSGPPILKACEAVSFGQHVWALLLFRDPWKLYDPSVQDAIKNPQSDVATIVQMIPVERLDVPPAVH